MRKYYIDNLRWMILLILIPYHAAMAWNTWNEPNYISFEGDQLISSFIVFFSPFFMPLLFLLAGMSTKYALKKRTFKEYLAERVKRLIIPSLFGIIVLMPIMTYIGDKFNYSYSGGFFEHYAVFFTKFTDLTGADGGFSVGQFWFLLYLFIISTASIGIIKLQRKFVSVSEKAIPFWLIFVFALPLPLFSEFLSIGGKSLVEYTYFFILGFYVFSDEKVICRLSDNCLILLITGTASAILDVYLFVWSGKEYAVLNSIAKYVAEWVMVLALLGLSKRYFDHTGKAFEYMRKRSFLFFIYHFVWVVLFQYMLYGIVGNSNYVLYSATVLLSYLATIVCCEISIRIPILCFLTGVKFTSGKKIR